MLLDIAPTLYMYEHTNMTFGMDYWHWFFYPQPAPFPEDAITGNLEKWWVMIAGRNPQVGWMPDDEKEYKKYFFQPETVHAICEDYRASVTIDLDHDRADRAAGKKLVVPELCVLWGKKGIIEQYDDVLGVWRSYSEDWVQISGQTVESGHFIPEQAPEGLMAVAKGFLGL